MNGSRNPASHRLARGGVCVLTPPGIDEAWVDRCLAPVLGERPGILQLRLKEDGRKAAALASRLRALTRAAGTLFIVNDDVDLAQACGADGVHLGRDDLPPEAARRRLGDAAIIGASCYGELDRATASIEAGVDYLAFGAIFASATKPGAPVIGTAFLREARQRFPLPLVAIGGITVAGATACRAAGADWIAVVDALWGDVDPVASLRSLHAALEAGPARGQVLPRA